MANLSIPAVDDLAPHPVPAARWQGVAVRRVDVGRGSHHRRDDGGARARTGLVQFAQAQIEAAQQRDIITEGDARRLLAYLTPSHQDGAVDTSAAQLFNEAIDDPSSRLGDGATTQRARNHGAPGC